MKCWLSVSWHDSKEKLSQTKIARVWKLCKSSSEFENKTFNDSKYWSKPLLKVHQMPTEIWFLLYKPLRPTTEWSKKTKFLRGFDAERQKIGLCTNDLLRCFAAGNFCCLLRQYWWPETRALNWLKKNFADIGSVGGGGGGRSAGLWTRAREAMIFLPDGHEGHLLINPLVPEFFFS